MAELSIHDNRIVSYEVDGERERIVFHTRFEETEPFEKTDLIFDKVFAYHLEHDNFGNIIYGVEEISLSGLLTSQRPVFERGQKYGWPGPWNGSPESSLEHLEADGAKAFQISSSYGLTGWVIARSCHVEEASAGRAPGSLTPSSS
jgi:hypothetical protein